jgi:transposase
VIKPEVRLPTAGLPTIRDRKQPVITIGIDPHKSSLTAVALQPSGEITATIRLEVNSDTVDRLLAWAIRWTQRQWAVEGAAGLGRGVAQGLAGAGEPVLDVPAQLAARARLLNTGHARKTDPIDAAAVAMVAQHHRRLHPVRAEGHSIVLRLLSERRDDLTEERTRTANRLHALLRDLIAGGAKQPHR